MATPLPLSVKWAEIARNGLVPNENEVSRGLRETSFPSRVSRSDLELRHQLLKLPGELGELVGFLSNLL